MNDRPGPYPVSVPPALSPSRRRVLQTAMDLDENVVTIQQVAERVGGHANSSRQHLDALVELKLLTSTNVASSRPGRRRRGYSFTALGRQALGAGRVDETKELAEVMASYLVASGNGVSEARSIGRAWGDRRADELSEEQSRRPLDAVIEVLDILGFDPASIATDEGDAVVLRTCPLLHMAERSPEFICNIHHGLIDGVLRRIGAREGIELLPFSEPHGCRLKLTAPTPLEKARRAS